MTRLALPVLLRVALLLPTTTAVKPSVVQGLDVPQAMPNTGAGALARPEKLAVCAPGATSLPLAVKVSARLALRVPAPGALVGLNCSVMVQAPPAGTVAGAQDSAVMLKSAALVPASVRL